MTWFFCADEGINSYLQNQPPLKIELVESSAGEAIATCHLDLKELSMRVAQHHTYRAALEPAHRNLARQLAFKFVNLNVNVGSVKFRELECGMMRLRRRQGLYFPTTPFITHSLPPDGWDPCNEELVAQIARGGGAGGGRLIGDDTATSMEGTVIPRSRASTRLMERELRAWATGVPHEEGRGAGRGGGRKGEGEGEEEGKGARGGRPRIPVEMRCAGVIPTKTLDQKLQNNYKEYSRMMKERDANSGSNAVCSSPDSKPTIKPKTMSKARKGKKEKGERRKGEGKGVDATLTLRPVSAALSAGGE